MIYIFYRNWVATRCSAALHDTFTYKQYTKYIERRIWEVRSVPRLCELYIGICLTTEEKHGKTSVREAQYKNNEKAQYKNNEQAQYKNNEQAQYKKNGQAQYKNNEQAQYKNN